MSEKGEPGDRGIVFDGGESSLRRGRPNTTGVCPHQQGAVRLRFRGTPFPGGHHSLEVSGGTSSQLVRWPSSSRGRWVKIATTQRRQASCSTTIEVSRRRPHPPPAIRSSWPGGSFHSSSTRLSSSGDSTSGGWTPNEKSKSDLSNVSFLTRRRGGCECDPIDTMDRGQEPADERGSECARDKPALGETVSGDGVGEQ